MAEPLDEKWRGGARRFAPVPAWTGDRPPSPQVPASTTTIARGGPSIRVLTYNILADAYATARAFPTTHPDHLAWPSRKDRLLAEIESLGCPDILCLQEVEDAAWAGDDDDSEGVAAVLGSALRSLGYDGAWLWSAPPPPGGAFTIKPRRAAGGKRQPRVGPALLWRASRFEAGRTAAIAFRDARCAPALAGGHAPTATLLGGGRDGAVAALLTDRETGAAFLACSAHLNWDTRTPDLKALQAAALLDELGRLGGGGGDGEPPPPSPLSPPLPLILGGDFNSLPVERADNEAPDRPSCAGQASGVYALLTSGILGGGHPHHPARQRGGAAAPLTTGRWAGGLASARACAAAGGGGGSGGPEHEPALTTRTASFQGTLDYIFYSPGDWDVAAVLADPWPADGGGPPADAFPPMPNEAWPSDHLAVGAVLVGRRRACDGARL